MKFLHGYVPSLWAAYEKSGLLDSNSGIRFCQSIDIDESLKFNNLAAENGTLFDLLKDTRCPFYIDRLQGGCFFEGYDYDMRLVGKYRDMLGDNFYGFQMHEWMSNFVSDTDKLVRANCPEPWTENGIIAAIRKEYDYEHIFTESMSPAELAEAGHITDPDVYTRTMVRLFEKRQKYTGGKVVPCDSAILAYPIELICGAEHIMAEIGAQTKHTAVQTAYARGMSKAYGRDFGAYYEPWGGNPFSACNYHENSENEWAIDAESFPFKTAGGNGGSSRSLQKRIMLYSYLSGAAFFSEEWGAFNTFYDRRDFALSPYGEVKRDFIRFMRKYPNIGGPLTPVAVVLPEETLFLDAIDNADTDLHTFRPADGYIPVLSSLRKGLRHIYASSETYGNENGSLENLILPDAFDIVNEDVFDEKKYVCAVDLTGRESFRKKFTNCVAPEDAGRVLGEILPCKVSGELHHMINSASDGCYLTVFNNTGVDRTVADGEKYLPEAKKTVTVTVKDGRKLSMLEGNADISYNGGIYSVTVPAGEFFFGKF